MSMNLVFKMPVKISKNFTLEFYSIIHKHNCQLSALLMLITSGKCIP